MARFWCEGAGEFRFYDADEFHDYGGVSVHTSGRWHLTNGSIIEMESEGVPKLLNGQPVVDVGDMDAAAAEDARVDYGAFEVAPEAEP